MIGIAKPFSNLTKFWGWWKWRHNRKRKMTLIRSDWHNLSARARGDFKLKRAGPSPSLSESASSDFFFFNFRLTSGWAPWTRLGISISSA
jgi:hypothetical protein